VGGPVLLGSADGQLELLQRRRAGIAEPQGDAVAAVQGGRVGHVGRRDVRIGGSRFRVEPLLQVDVALEPLHRLPVLPAEHRRLPGELREDSFRLVGVTLAVAHVGRHQQQGVSVPAVPHGHQEMVGHAARLAVQADPPQAVGDPVARLEVDGLHPGALVGRQEGVGDAEVIPLAVILLHQQLRAPLEGLQPRVPAPAVRESAQLGKARLERLPVLLPLVEGVGLLEEDPLRQLEAREVLPEHPVVGRDGVPVVLGAGQVGRELQPGAPDPDVGHDDGALHGFLGVGVPLDDGAVGPQGRVVLLHLGERAGDQVAHLLAEGVLGVEVDGVREDPDDTVVSALPEVMESQAHEGLPGDVPVVGPAPDGLREGLVGLLRVLHLAVALGDPVGAGLRPGPARKLPDVGPEGVDGRAVLALAVQLHRFGVEGLVFRKTGARLAVLRAGTRARLEGRELEVLRLRQPRRHRVTRDRLQPRGEKRGLLSRAGRTGGRRFDLHLGGDCRVPQGRGTGGLRARRGRGRLPRGRGFLRRLGRADGPDGEEADDLLLLELRPLSGRLLRIGKAADVDAHLPVPAVGLLGKGLASLALQEPDLLGRLFGAGVRAHVKAVGPRASPGGDRRRVECKQQQESQTGKKAFFHGPSHFQGGGPFRAHHRLTGRKQWLCHEKKGLRGEGRGERDPGRGASRAGRAACRRPRRLKQVAAPCPARRADPRKLEGLVKILTIAAENRKPGSAGHEKTGECIVPGTLFDGTDGIDGMDGTDFLS